MKITQAEAIDNDWTGLFPLTRAEIAAFENTRDNTKDKKEQLLELLYKEQAYIAEVKRL